MKKYFTFLDGRAGASDGDVDALRTTFGLSEQDAASVYNAWLDALLN